jgi:uncharacterized protein
MPSLDRITIFPVKSLDGIDVPEATVLPSGGLVNDRRWQLVDMEGRVLNAKRSPLLHAIRAAFELAGDDARTVAPAGASVVSLAIDPLAVVAKAIPGIERLASLGPSSFPLLPGAEGPCGWLSEAFGFGVLLLERPDGGFPDDRDAPGPTVISTATLEEVARWFRVEEDECRRRFRANLEVGGCDAFWEDTLASPALPDLRPSLLDLPADLPADPYADLPPPEPREFSIGDTRFKATNVCRRCVVPSRDSRTGAVTAQFRDVFEAWRGRRMPDDVDASNWKHVYRLAINTRVVSPGMLAAGAALVEA